MRKIIVIGSSGHAKSVAEILENLDYEIVGFINSFIPKGKKVLKYRTVGNEDVLLNSEKNFGTKKVVAGSNGID